MKFQVADVHKPLIVVGGLVEKGNRPVFGPGPEENYIQSVKSGKKVHMRMKNSGSYMLDIDMQGKSGKAEVRVDSGDEESVCPVAWAGEFPIKEPTRWRGFRGATGAEIKHHGEREVVAEPIF